MRRSFDGLMSLIRDTYQMDPYADALYLFCGRKRNTLKALYFDQTGFVLCTKRLDNGKFQWPRDASQVRPLTRQGRLSTTLFFSGMLSTHNAAPGRKTVDNLPEKCCF